MIVWLCHKRICSIMILNYFIYICFSFISLHLLLFSPLGESPVVSITRSAVASVPLFWCLESVTETTRRLEPCCAVVSILSWSTMSLIWNCCWCTTLLSLLLLPTMFLLSREKPSSKELSNWTSRLSTIRPDCKLLYAFLSLFFVLFLFAIS